MPWFIPWFYRFAKVVCDLGMPFWLVQLVIFWVQCTQRQWPTPGKAAHKINNFHQVFNSSFLDETKNILPMVQPFWDFHQITLHALTYHKNYISKPPPKKNTKSLKKTQNIKVTLRHLLSFTSGFYWPDASGFVPCLGASNSSSYTPEAGGKERWDWNGFRCV